MIRVSNLHKVYGDSRRGVPAVNGVSFDVDDGLFVTLLGPSGCGKTTTLRLLAGLERPTYGAIYIDDECMCSAENHIFRPAHRRPVGMVFQSYAIWPHMTVSKNVGFPLRIARPRIGRAEIERRVQETLAVVGLEEVGNRMATELSGGQQQRVALARALIRNPKILLLDEPLSNLDAELRERMRDEVRELQQRLGITTVFVTHDQSEALAMSDRISVMNSGRIVESGSPQDIYRSPRRTFTARFLGASNNFSGHIADRDGEFVTIRTEYGSLTCRASKDAKVGDEVTVAVRPDAFVIRHEPRGAAAWRGTIRLSTYHGEAWTYHVDIGTRTIKVRTARETEKLSHGDEVFLVPEVGAGVITDDEDRGLEARSEFAAAGESPADSMTDSLKAASAGVENSRTRL